MSPLINNPLVLKIALVLYLDHARERIETLCCQQHTLSGSIVHVVSHTYDKYSAHLLCISIHFYATCPWQNNANLCNYNILQNF